MTRLSIGIQSPCDIKELSVFQRRELFSPSETSFCKNAVTLAGNLAAKKAFLSCLDIRNGQAVPFYPLVEVKRSPVNRPFIEIRDSSLREKIGDRSISLSISHTRDIAVAVCIIYNK